MPALLSAQSLPPCHGTGDHHRWPMKTRALDHFVTKPLTVDELLHLSVPSGVARASNDAIDPFETFVWRIPVAYVWLVKQSLDDCDAHFQLSATPTPGAPQFIAEIPALDTDGQRAALRVLGLARLGPSAHHFARPIAVSVVGWGFFDLAHQCARDPQKGCQHGSASVATLAELHPARIQAVAR